MELLNVPLFFMNNLNRTKNQKSGETHARIFKINFTATDRLRTHKNFTFSAF